MWCAVWPSRINSERGGALIATTVISVLMLGLLVWYLSQASLTARLQTHEHSAVVALHYAETGLLLAEQALQSPSVLAGTGTVTESREMPNGRCAYTLFRSSPLKEDPSGVNPFQQVLVDAYATGYFYLGQGAVVDPTNGRAAQLAVLRAKIGFQAAGSFLVASPGRLRVAQGTTAHYGPMYARELIFAQDPDPLQLNTVIDGAFFGDTVKRHDGFFEPSPDYVIFDSTGGAQPIGTIPHFPALGGTIRAYYKSLAASEGSRLADGASLDGRTAPPINNPFPIYYCQGDLHLGRVMGFEPARNMIVYVEGDLFIHNSMREVSHSWAAFLVEKDIRLEVSASAAELLLRGTFMANGALRWDGSQPPSRSFTISLTGSLLAGKGFDEFAGRTPMKFIRWQVDDAILPLPRLTQLLETEIVKGKYRR